jgi:DHA1 family bicyclomycin/chloramphenicol resistance-like MFS transporter
MLRPDTFALTALLGTLTAIGVLSVDMYLPSLPDIGQGLRVPAAQVQLTLSSYLVGFAIGQLIYGPLSDRWGRKPVLIGALALFTVASVACAVAPSIETLIAARFFQALGGAGASVLARAVVRDLYEGPRAGRELSLMGSIMALAPIFAPFAGGVMQTFFGWRSNFVALVVVGCAAMAVVWWLLPETLRIRAPEPVSVRSMVRVFGTLAQNRAFLAFLGISALVYMALFAWLSGASFVLQDFHGLSPIGFAWAFAVGAIGYLIGTLIAARIVTRLGIDRTIGYGCGGLVAGGVLMLVMQVLAPGSAAGLYVSVAIFLAGLGLVLPQAMAGALMPFPDRAGAASSLLGAVQQFSAAAFGALIGHMLGHSPWPVVIGITVTSVLALALWMGTRELRGRAELRRQHG